MDVMHEYANRPRPAKPCGGKPRGPYGPDNTRGMYYSCTRCGFTLDYLEPSPFAQSVFVDKWLRHARTGTSA